MKKLLSVALMLIFTGTLTAVPVDNPCTPKKKKIIDLSWSNPSVDYLVEHLDRMQQEAPINGITLRLVGRRPGIEGKAGEVYSQQPMTREAWQYEWFSEQIGKLKNLKFTRFTDNFLTTAMRPAENMDWFDDAYWAAICNNYGILARITKECNLTGIVFDPEEYAGPVWRHYPGHSHDDAIVKARQRGREWGQAVFTANPDIKILALFLFSNGMFLSADQVESTLSHAFFNGVYDVIPPTATMIEGHEFFGYLANSDAEFFKLRMDMDFNFLSRVTAGNYTKYRTQTQLAAPIYLDSMFFENNPVRKHLKPEIDQIPRLDYIRQNLQRALSVSDEYVWVYSELGCWWTQSPHPRVKQSWEEQLPGINRIFIELVNPAFLTATVDNLLEIPSGREMGKWLFWTARNHQGQGGWQNGIAFIRGTKNTDPKGVIGSVHYSIPCIPGHEYILSVEARPASETITGSATLTAAFRATDNSWMHRNKRTVQIRNKQRGEWETLTIRIVAPENSKILYFQMGCSGLKANEAIEFRNPRLVDLTAVQ